MAHILFQWCSAVSFFAPLSSNTKPCVTHPRRRIIVLAGVWQRGGCILIDKNNSTRNQTKKKQQYATGLFCAICFLGWVEGCCTYENTLDNKNNSGCIHTVRYAMMLWWWYGGGGGGLCCAMGATRMALMMMLLWCYYNYNTHPPLRVIRVWQ